MGWPGAGELTFEGTSVEHVAGPPEVRLLGHGAVEYSVDEDNHLQVTVPELDEADRPSDIAVTFAIEKIDLSATNTAHR